MNSGVKNVLTLLICVLATEAAGVIGSIFTLPAIPTWYADLAKPVLTPPSWVFGPVWTFLYALMGVSVFIVWSKGRETPGAGVALGVFVAQLILNILWSAAFFGLQAPSAAFIVIAILWIAIVTCITVFRRISRLASWLLYPYILWVTFAAYLNLAIWLGMHA